MRNFLRLFDPRDIRDHFRSEMCSWAFEAPGEPITLRMRYSSFRYVIMCRVYVAICDVRGHDYDADGVDYPESGGEGFTCKRCGHGFTAWH